MIGCEYATIFSTIGAHVYLVNDKEQILPFIDQEVANDLVKQMQENEVEILFNTSIESIKVPTSDEELIEIKLKSGELLHVDMFLLPPVEAGTQKH